MENKEFEQLKEKPQAPIKAILYADYLCVKVFGILLALGGVIGAITCNNCYGVTSAIIVCLGIFILGVIFTWWGTIKIKEVNKQYEKQVDQYRIELEKYNDDILAYNIYIFCINKNINIQDEKAIAIVSNNFSVPREEIVKVYNTGKKYAEELNYKKYVDRITAEKQKEKEEYDAIYQNTKIVGKDKYLKRKYKELEDNIKMVNTCDSGINRCGQLTQTKAKTSDWAILGGMANGIAGPAAGLATAYDIQKKNEEAKRSAEEIRSQAFDNQVFLREQKFNYEHKVYVLKNYIEEVNNRLYDESDPKEKIGLIHAMVQNYKILDTKNMRICLKFDCEKEIHILNSEALIDGSIQINILKNREIVGTTYYCAPGFDKDAVARTVTGFGAVLESETIALGSFEEGIDYEFEIKPYKLWCIER